MVCSGISDEVIASVYFEKSPLKEMIMIIIIIITSKWKKKDVGMAKCFSKKYGNKGRDFNYQHSE